MEGVIETKETSKDAIGNITGEDCCVHQWNQWIDVHNFD